MKIDKPKSPALNLKCSSNTIQYIVKSFKDDNIRRKKRTREKEVYLTSTLSISHFSYTYFKNEKQEKQFECVICQEEIKKEDKIHYLHCGHKFHCDCINLWFKHNYNKKTCPICRSKSCTETSCDNNLLEDERIWDIFNLDIPNQVNNTSNENSNLFEDIAIFLLFLFWIIIGLINFYSFYSPINP